MKKTGETELKKLKQKRRNRLITFLLASFALIISLGLYLGGKESEKLERERSADAVVRNVMDTHERNKADITDVWWMYDNQISDLDKTYYILTERATAIDRAVRKYENLSANTKAIANRFHDILTSVWDGHQATTLRKQDGSLEEIHTNFVIICFVGRNTADREHVYMPMWNTSKGFMTIPAINTPEPMLAAMIYHELGHAKRHNKVDGKPPAKFDSYESYAEEVMMHELGGSILNAESNGKYYALLDEIGSRFDSAQSFKGAIAMITEEDCVKLDRMFDCTNTRLPSSILLTQAILEIGFRYCEKHTPDMEKKVEVYKYFDDNIFSPEPRK